MTENITRAREKVTIKGRQRVIDKKKKREYLNF